METLTHGRGSAWHTAYVATKPLAFVPHRPRPGSLRTQKQPWQNWQKRHLPSDKVEDAIAAASALVRMSPTTIEPHLIRASAYVSEKNWQKAEDDCRAALHIHPLHPQARVMLGVCRYHRGDSAGGRKEAETAAGLTTSPQQRDAVLAWYRRETR